MDEVKIPDVAATPATPETPEKAPLAEALPASTPAPETPAQ